MASKSTQSPLQQCSPRGSSKSPDSVGSIRRIDSGKLGDFTKLHSLSSVLMTPSKPSSPSSQVSGTLGFMTPDVTSSQRSNKHATLGDFSRIFNRLAASAPVSPSPPVVHSFPGESTTIEGLKRPSSPRLVPSIPIIEETHQETSPTKTSFKKASSVYDSSTCSDSSSGSDSDQEPNSTYSTPVSSPSASAGEELSPLTKFAKIKSKARSPKTTRSVPTIRHSVAPKSKPQNQFQEVLTYQYYNHGPTSPVFDLVPTQEVKHSSLIHKLVPNRVVDKILSVENRQLESNGVHVFLDMSNISISFQKALRARYSLPESVRFTPLPAMNLPFLHELLIRGRDIKLLNAGCSMRRDRPEPSYIQELRDLGYRVDLRYRRREGDQSPEETRGTSGHTRYVEDMVDETLQTRIGESVMQYFDEPGTLVMVTGDARPAKFSDGFFTYAERALKMGWNVEVISWKSSLSGAWTNRDWAQPWGDRFRVIELDGFLDELFACYAS